MNIDYSLYLVTDERYTDLLVRVEKLLERGVTLVQYRAKHKSTATMLSEAQATKQLCDKYQVPLLINDRIDIALAVQAAGVHLGQKDMPCVVARKILGKDALIGISVHNLVETQQAITDGADYLGVGAVFSTNTKKDVEVLGLNGLQEICACATIPVVGIGGINFDNKDKVINVGADGVAMVTTLLDGVGNEFK